MRDQSKNYRQKQTDRSFVSLLVGLHLPVHIVHFQLVFNFNLLSYPPYSMGKLVGIVEWTSRPFEALERNGAVALIRRLFCGFYAAFSLIAYSYDIR
ncbi:MAG: hypothetical protein GY820_28465 [Gammaproteobacteria bacterium]|nr:hypothetical protein [Gammaproteobacteria bacterium]